MRPSDAPPARVTFATRLTLVPLLSVALFGAACRVPLDDEFDDGGLPPSDAAAETPVASGCTPFSGTSAVTAIAGDLRSLALADGGALWIADQATLADGGLALAPSFVVGAGARDDCTGWGVTYGGPSLAPSPLRPDGFAAPLDLVQTSAGPALYYQLFVADPTQPLGLRALGVGLAPRDATTGLFAPTAELLWSADRPAYGGSAYDVGGVVYVFGCRSTAPLTSDCYVAKVDDAHADSAAGYAYWAGDRWSASADDAASIARAGGSVSVRPDAARAGRWLMTYVPPLGDELFARSAIAPEGPWSAPVTLATCPLARAGDGAFCGGAQQHVELSRAPGSIAVTFAARSFASDAGPPAAFWPRLAELAVPGALP